MSSAVWNAVPARAIRASVPMQLIRSLIAPMDSRICSAMLVHTNGFWDFVRGSFGAQTLSIQPSHWQVYLLPPVRARMAAIIHDRYWPKRHI